MAGSLGDRVGSFPVWGDYDLALNPLLFVSFFFTRSCLPVLRATIFVIARGFKVGAMASPAGTFSSAADSRLPTILPGKDGMGDKSTTLSDK